MFPKNRMVRVIFTAALNWAQMIQIHSTTAVLQFFIFTLQVFLLFPGFMDPCRMNVLGILHWCILGLPWGGTANLWQRPSVIKPWRSWLLFRKHVSCAQFCAHHRWANTHTCGLCFIISCGMRIWSTMQDRNNDFGEMDPVNHTGPPAAKC